MLDWASQDWLRRRPCTTEECLYLWKFVCPTDLRGVATVPIRVVGRYVLGRAGSMPGKCLQLGLVIQAPLPRVYFLMLGNADTVQNKEPATLANNIT